MKGRFSFVGKRQLSCVVLATLLSGSFACVSAYDYNTSLRFTGHSEHDAASIPGASLTQQNDTELVSWGPRGVVNVTGNGKSPITVAANVKLNMVASTIVAKGTGPTIDAFSATDGDNITINSNIIASAIGNMGWGIRGISLNRAGSGEGTESHITINGDVTMYDHQGAEPWAVYTTGVPFGGYDQTDHYRGTRWAPVGIDLGQSNGSSITVNGMSELAVKGIAVKTDPFYFGKTIKDQTKLATINLQGAKIITPNDPNIGYYVLGNFGGTINVNMQPGETDAGHNLVQMKGNVIVMRDEPGPKGSKDPYSSSGGQFFYRTGRINVGMSGKGSFWHGTVDNTGTNRTGDFNLWLKNGAQWYNEAYSKLNGMDPEHMPTPSNQNHYQPYDHITHVANLIGDGNESKAGYVTMNNTDPLSIKNYKGAVNFIYSHKTNGATTDDFTGGKITIDKAEAGSIANLITDNNGLNTNDNAAVVKVLNALAGKLVYVAHGDNNLKGTAKIASGLTASDAALKVGPIVFNSEGVGTVTTAQDGAPQSAASSGDGYNVQIVGADLKRLSQTYWEDEGVKVGDNVYNFTSNSTIDVPFSDDVHKGFNYNFYGIVSWNGSKDGLINLNNKKLTLVASSDSPTFGSAGIWNQSSALTFNQVGGLDIKASAKASGAIGIYIYGNHSLGIYQNGQGNANTTINNDLSPDHAVNIEITKGDLITSAGIKADKNSGTALLTIKGLANVKMDQASPAVAVLGGTVSLGGGKLESPSNYAIHVANKGSVTDNAAPGTGYVTPLSPEGTINIEGATVVSNGSNLRMALPDSKSTILGRVAVYDLDEGNPSSLSLYMGKGATWTNKALVSSDSSGSIAGPSSLEEDSTVIDTSSNVVDAPSHISYFNGDGAIVKQEDSQPITIDNYKGTMNLWYDHGNQGTSASDFSAAGVVINHAEPGAVVSLITDGTGVSESDKETVYNNLAGKLTYTGWVNGEYNLKAKLGLSSGMTAPSESVFVDGTFNDTTGVGLYAASPRPDQTTDAFTKTITGSKATNEGYVNQGVLYQDGQYTFRKASSVTVNPGPAVDLTEDTTLANMAGPLTLTGTGTSADPFAAVTLGSAKKLTFKGKLLQVQANNEQGPASAILVKGDAHNKDYDNTGDLEVGAKGTKAYGIEIADGGRVFSTAPITVKEGALVASDTSLGSKAGIYVHRDGNDYTGGYSFVDREIKNIRPNNKVDSPHYLSYLSSSAPITMTMKDGIGIYTDGIASDARITGDLSITMNNATGSKPAYALATHGGSIDVNFDRDSKSAIEVPEGQSAPVIKLVGNVGIIPLSDEDLQNDITNNFAGPSINMALVGEQSSWRGVADYHPDSETWNDNVSNSSNIIGPSLYLSDKASWTNEAVGPTSDSFAGSYLTNLSGAANSISAPSIYMKDTHPLTINQYAGITNVYYGHTGDGSTKDKFGAGDIHILNVNTDGNPAVMNLITDNSGINVSDQALTNKVLDALAQKLIVDEDAQSSMKGTVSIASGLTSSAVQQATGLISFPDESSGVGHYVPLTGTMEGAQFLFDNKPATEYISGRTGGINQNIDKNYKDNYLPQSSNLIIGQDLVTNLDMPSDGTGLKKGAIVNNILSALNATKVGNYGSLDNGNGPTFIDMTNHSLSLGVNSEWVRSTSYNVPIGGGAYGKSGISQVNGIHVITNSAVAIKNASKLTVDATAGNFIDSYAIPATGIFVLNGSLALSNVPETTVTVSAAKDKGTGIAVIKGGQVTSDGLVNVIMKSVGKAILTKDKNSSITIGGGTIQSKGIALSAGENTSISINKAGNQHVSIYGNVESNNNTGHIDINLDRNTSSWTGGTISNAPGLKTDQIHVSLSNGANWYNKMLVTEDQTSVEAPPEPKASGIGSVGGIIPGGNWGPRPKPPKFTIPTRKPNVGGAGGVTSSTGSEQPNGSTGGTSISGTGSGSPTDGTVVSGSGGPVTIAGSGGPVTIAGSGGANSGPSPKISGYSPRPLVKVEKKKKRRSWLGPDQGNNGSSDDGSGVVSTNENSNNVVTAPVRTRRSIDPMMLIALPESSNTDSANNQGGTNSQPNTNSSPATNGQGDNGAPAATTSTLAPAPVSPSAPTAFAPVSADAPVQDQYVDSLTGGATAAEAGNLRREDKNTLTIGMLSGNVNVFYEHSGDGTKLEDYTAGNTIIQKAAPNTGLQVLTDRTGITSDSEAVTNKVLESLAAKIIYQPFPNGERNIIGKVGIASGLTASQTLLAKDMTFDSVDGHGILKSDTPEVAPSPLIDGVLADQKNYVDSGNLDPETMSYTFDKPLNIESNEGGKYPIEAKEPVIVAAPGQSITLKNTNQDENNQIPTVGIFTDGPMVSVAADTISIASLNKSNRSEAIHVSGSDGNKVTVANIIGNVDMLSRSGGQYALGIYAAGNSNLSISGNVSALGTVTSPYGSVAKHPNIGNDVYYGASAIYSGSDYTIQKGATVSVDGDVNLNVGVGAGVVANGGGSAVNISGGGTINVQPIDPSKHNYALVAQSGTITMNVDTTGKKPNYDKDLTIHGNIGLISGSVNVAEPVKDTKITVGLVTPKSSWTGAAINNFTDAQDKLGYKEDFTLYLQNGATWHVKPVGAFNSPAAEEHVDHLIGSENPQTAGIISQEDEYNPLHIYNYAGNTVLMYPHDQGSDVIKGKETYIDKAEPGSNIRMFTDNNGIDMNNSDAVRKVLSNLAAKLYYTDATAGKKDLTASANIASGLTASGASTATAPISFKTAVADKGQGYIDNASDVAALTEATLPKQHGRLHIVSGAYETPMMAGVRHAITGEAISWRDQSLWTPAMDEDKMGDLHAIGPWAELLGSSKEFKKDGGLTMKSKGARVGFTKRVDANSVMGGVMTFLNGDDSFAEGSAKTKNYTFSLYGIKDLSPTSSLSFVGSIGQLDSEFKAYNEIGTELKGHYMGSGYSASVTYSKRYDARHGIYVRPLLQLGYGQVIGQYTGAATDKASMSIVTQPYNSLLSRVGFKLGRDTEKLSVYASLYGTYAFGNHVETTYSSGDGGTKHTSFTTNGSWVTAGLGGTYRFAPDTMVSLSLGRSFGSQYSEPWQWKARVQYHF